MTANTLIKKANFCSKMYLQMGRDKQEQEILWNWYINSTIIMKLILGKEIDWQLQRLL